MVRRAKAPHPRLIDPRNRVALSRDVLRALDVGPGDYITFVLDEGGVRILKLNISLAPPKRTAGRERGEP